MSNEERRNKQVAIVQAAMDELAILGECSRKEVITMMKGISSDFKAANFPLVDRKHPDWFVSRFARFVHLDAKGAAKQLQKIDFEINHERASVLWQYCLEWILSDLTFSVDGKTAVDVQLYHRERVISLAIIEIIGVVLMNGFPRHAHSLPIVMDLLKQYPESIPHSLAKDPVGLLTAIFKVDEARSKLGLYLLFGRGRSFAENIPEVLQKLRDALVSVCDVRGKYLASINPQIKKEEYRLNAVIPMVDEVKFYESYVQKDFEFIEFRGFKMDSPTVWNWKNTQFKDRVQWACHYLFPQSVGTKK